MLVPKGIPNWNLISREILKGKGGSNHITRCRMGMDIFYTCISTQPDCLYKYVVTITNWYMNQCDVSFNSFLELCTNLLLVNENRHTCIQCS